MAPPKFGFNSYVDIAICKDNGREKLSHSVSEWCETTEAHTSSSNWTGIDFEINPPDLLKFEWTKRIEEWQKLLPNGGPPVEDCSSLQELQFCALFLQYPLAGMALWNVMQTFYALDRLVCCTSKESLDKIAEWESMPPFKYLEASKVEKRWRSSLQTLRKEIKDGNNKDAPLPHTDSILSGVPKIEGIRGESKRSLKGSKNRNRRDILLRRIDGIFSGIAKLEDSQGELKRNLKENLKGVKLVDLMLESISVAARRRFSMIDNYLKVDENHEGGKKIEDGVEDVESLVNSTCDSSFQNSKFPTIGEPRFFKPLSRSNSIDVVKQHLVMAWVSTRRGEATASAIVILFILLVCLHQIQRCLIVRS